MRVLVADDDPVSRRFVAFALRNAGCEVVLVEDGTTAWRVLEGEDSPRLVLLDWSMPGMDGLELCRRLRTLAGPFYVVMLTANESADEIVQALEAGADDHIAKPFHPQVLRARLLAGQRILALQDELHGKVEELEGMMTSLAERSAELEASEARARSIVDSAFHAVILIDSTGAVCDFNPAAERTFGWSRSEVLGRSFLPLVFHPDRLAEAERAAVRLRDTGDVEAFHRRVEISAVRRSGESFPAELVLNRVGESETFAIFLRDLSETKRLEVELRQAQKLESVGRLASGIAHELNTPIQFIGDNVRFLADGISSLLRVAHGARQGLEAAAHDPSLAPSLLAQAAAAWQREDVSYLEEECPKAASQTLDGVDRVATIVRAMKEFAHPDGSDEKAPADLNRALASTLTVARNELKYVADVETDFGELPPVTCHVGELNQVFLNLLVNASHAIADVVGPSGGKGRIHVRTSCEGDAVVVAVSDSGGGIPEEIRSRIFDPFFTTKEVGRGTGQGLAIAYNVVVEKHGGRLSFESEMGKGTTFFVRLPVSPAAVPASAEEAA